MTDDFAWFVVIMGVWSWYAFFLWAAGIFDKTNHD